MMDIKRGQPVTDGRYMAFTHAEGAKEWVLPIMLLWHGGKWTYQASVEKFPRPIYGWVGPLPVGRVVDFFPEIQDTPTLEFDL